MSVAERKAALRAQALARRDGLDPAYRAVASRRIADRLLAMAEGFPPGPVSVFWPIRSEIDTRPLMQSLCELGRRVALPVVAKPALVFRPWHPGEALQPAGFGLSEPLERAGEIDPATMLIPLAAFDRGCNRIGYGAGYYDRTIARLSRSFVPLKIGLAFAAQQVENVPVESHDAVLDFVVTEDDVFGGGRG
jgi:5-formyltetrahydrofolate cyclo-ligase